MLPEIKGRELRKLADKFIYSEAVKKTSKKREENCSADMDDLFRRIFDLDAERRITFSEIRYHPIFAKHFKDEKPYKDFPVEEEIIERRKNELSFFGQCAEFFLGCGGILEKSVSLMVAHDIMKGCIAMVGKMRGEMDVEGLSEKYPDRKWARFLVGQAYRQIMKEVDENLKKN